MKRVLLLTSTALMALVGCSTPSTNPGGLAQVCAPGATQLCWCAPGAQGVQSCFGTGFGWAACQCGGLDGQGGDLPVDDAAVADEQDAPDPNGTDASADAVDVVADSATDAAADADDDAADWAGYFDDVPDTTDASDAKPAFECSERSKLVYVVSAEKVLLSFQPADKELKVVGTLNCPAPAGDTPFAMGVDRNADAWVLYQSSIGQGGSLYKVSTLDASCEATAFQPGQKGFELFGMAFVSQNQGLQDETLYIAGAPAGQFSSGTGSLGKVSFPDLTVTKIGSLNSGPGSPDLTGNGVGQLWAFFPSTSPPSVRKLNVQTAATDFTFPLPAQSFSGVQAWAFAWWGGDFYLFFKSGFDGSSAVWKLASDTGEVSKVIANSGYTLVGAGVSSCAPNSQPTP